MGPSLPPKKYRHPASLAGSSAAFPPILRVAVGVALVDVLVATGLRRFDGTKHAE